MPKARLARRVFLRLGKKKSKKVQAFQERKRFDRAGLGISGVCRKEKERRGQQRFGERGGLLQANQEEYKIIKGRR